MQDEPIYNTTPPAESWPTVLVLDNTFRERYRDCKMKYNLSVNHGIMPDKGSTALRYGAVFHKVLDAYYSFILINGWAKQDQAIEPALAAGQEEWYKLSRKQHFDDDYRSFENLATGFLSYINYTNSIEDFNYLTIVATEEKFEVPIHRETREERLLYGHLPPIMFTGRIDLRMQVGGLNWINDFKTTGWHINDLMNKMHRSMQLLGYSYAKDLLYDDVTSGCMVTAHFVKSSKLKSGDWGKLSLDNQRMPVIFSDSDLQEWRKAFLDTCKDLNSSYSDRVWPCSFDNCYQYGQCTYYSLCTQHRAVEDMNLEGFHTDYWSVLDE